MPEQPTIHDVMGRLDAVSSNMGLARACMWGAFHATAPADRWDRAAADLEAAASELAAATAALAGMRKAEPYCTACDGPLLSLSGGWSHFTPDGRGAAAAGAGHEPELDWREARPAGPPVADGSLAAALADIRERNERSIARLAYTEHTVAMVAEGDVRRLLAAVEAVSALAAAATARLSGAGCHGGCDDGPCGCASIPVAWSLDPEAVRAAIIRGLNRGEENNG